MARFDGGLALDGCASLADEFLQVGADLAEDAGRGRLRPVGVGIGYFGLAGFERDEFLLEFAQPRPCGDVVHGAVLERGLVAADGGLLGLNLAGEGVGFGLPCGVAVVVLGGSAGYWR